SACLPLLFFSFLFLLPLLPFSTLFPYTTLFRSLLHHIRVAHLFFTYFLKYRTKLATMAKTATTEATMVAIRNVFEVDPAWYCFRSEEHTSELQSRFDLVCRLLLEKKNTCTYEQC